jgi:hypothetical protein
LATIKDILQFHFSPNALRLSAQNLIPVALSTLNDHRIDKLHKIIDEIGVGAFRNTGENLIPQVYRKFKNFLGDKNFDFDRRELRTLTYSLNFSEKRLPSIFSQIIELRHVLRLLDINWKDSFLFGLMDCFLRNWETKHRKSLELLEQFIFGKVDKYIGNRNALIAFKNNKQFFNSKNGDLILGDVIARQHKPIEEAAKFLGVPESWFIYPYFSKVILTNYERNKDNISNEINRIINAILIHNNSVTSKRLISKIIIQTNRRNFEHLQEKVKKIAFLKIGDPANTIKWAPFENASEAEKLELNEARNILNEWIAKQFIDVFFRVCINDERRKIFWLNIASRTRLTFKVYGSQRTKYMLKMEEKIAEYVDARFETVTSKKEVSAFILYIGDYMLIEFSNEGYACCAYRINSPNCPTLDSKLSSVDDLRNRDLSLAITSDSKFYYHSDEGRLFHKDGNDIWEAKFNNWINQKVFNEI